MNNSVTELPCGGCSALVGGVHVCPTCGINMHPFCGTPVGKEGYGQPILCPRCEPLQDFVVRSAGSTIVEAFQRAERAKNDEEAAAVLPALSEQTVDDTSGKGGDDNTKPLRPRSRPATTAISKRQKVVRWIETQLTQRDGHKSISASAVDEIPEIFNSRTRNANIAKAMDWWKKKMSLLEAKRGSTTLSSRRRGGRKRVSLKVLPGRGRQRAKWVTWMYGHLVDEFDRLRKAGLKFDASMLRQLALRSLRTQGDGYDEESVDANGAKLYDKITSRWIQSFMENHDIVLRAQTGKKQVSAAKQAQIEQEVAQHLGKVKRAFEDGLLNEETVENIDETHFVIDVDNGKTLGFVGEKQVKYADVVSGGEGMTMVVRISGGPGARVLPPMMIFMNQDSRYPIRGVKDDTHGVCYRTGPKGWIDQKIFRQYLCERRTMSADRLGRKKTIYLDNCSSHLREDQCATELQSFNAGLKFFPANATDLCQPADSFVIAKIKDAWARMWNEKKIDIIEGDQWQDKVRKDGSWSGKLKNPGKNFFLTLAAQAVREVNSHRDKNGINYARKAMIRSGLSLDLDGEWRTEQLFPHLQEIIRKNPDHFAGVSNSSLRASEENEEKAASPVIGILPSGSLYIDV